MTSVDPSGGSALGTAVPLVQTLVALSSLEEDDASKAAARDVVSAPDPGAAFDALYPALLHHKTLLTAFAHLEGAGGDLGQLTVSAPLYRSMWPLNALIPVPEEVAPGRIPLGGIREGLARHRTLLRGVVQNLLDLPRDHRFLFIFGRSLEAAYPGYPNRMDYDTDLFAPDIHSGLGLLEELRTALGYTLSRCKISRLDGPGLGVFNAFRASAEGHELHLDIMVGGYLARGSLRPLWFVPALWDRSRRVPWGGSNIGVPSAEDMVMITAVKTYRRREFTRRDFNDIRFLLTAEEGNLDWEYIVHTARLHQVHGSLHRLATEAERLSGRSLVPPPALRRLRPGRVEASLIERAAAVERSHKVVETAAGPVVRTQRQRLSSAWPALWVFRYGRRRLGTAGALTYLASERIQRQLFRLQFPVARSKSRRLQSLLPVMARSRVGFGSLCELRTTPPPVEVGFCLSRTPARRQPPPSLDEDARRSLFAVIDALPDRVVTEKIATTEGEERFEPHRCGAFIFNLGRIHRPPG